MGARAPLGTSRLSESGDSSRAKRAKKFNREQVEARAVRQADGVEPEFLKAMSDPDVFRIALPRNVLRRHGL